jgi:hypothetical protein
MPLIKCSDCETEMSSLAGACPKCGRPNQVVPPVVEKKAAPNKARAALVGSGIGFVLGGVLIWQGCAHGQTMTSQEITIAAFGGVIFAILGAILGAVLG